MLGALEDVPRIVNELNVDAVVIAMSATEERLREICGALKPCGVKVTHFSFSEEPL